MISIGKDSLRRACRRVERPCVMRRVVTALSLVVLAPAGSAWASHSAPVAQVSTGALAGVREGAVLAFLGVPYAAPPVGPNRWRAPQPPLSWRGTRAADHFAASCRQTITPAGFGPWTHEYVVQGPVSEDCLYLNVWTPAHAGAPRPVLVWIHGGGFSQGSGSVAIYDGSALAARGIVVVTINYRLGALGFFAHPQLTAEAAGMRAPPGNYGLQDMIAALKWLRVNVAAFGGDPRAITIAGQSAGAMAVQDLIASPLAAGLFARAIAESGLPNTVPAPSLAQAEQAGEAFARSKGATSLAALRALSPEQLSAGVLPSGPRFSPIVDGVLLPDSPQRLLAAGRINDTPMLIGLNADEGSGFSPNYGATSESDFRALLRRCFGSMASRFAPLYPAATAHERARSGREMLRDRGLAAVYAFSRLRLAHGREPLYGYLFTHAEPGPQSARYGAFHSAEIPYVFETLDKAPERGFTQLDRTLAYAVSRYWLNFVMRGSPNGPGLPSWPRMRSPDPLIMALGETIHPRPILTPRPLEAVNAFLASGGEPSLF